MRLSTVEKIWFTVSLAILSFGVGVATHAGGWLPTAYVEQVWTEVGTVIPSSGPDFSYPAVYNREGIRIQQPGEMQDGLTLLASAWQDREGWHPKVRLIDRNGNTVHNWTIRKERLFQTETHRKDPAQAGVHGIQLLPNGDVVANVEYVGMVRGNGTS